MRAKTPTRMDFLVQNWKALRAFETLVTIYQSAECTISQTWVFSYIFCKSFQCSCYVRQQQNAICNVELHCRTWKIIASRRLEHISLRKCSESSFKEKNSLKLSFSGAIEQWQFPDILILSKSVYHGSKQCGHCSQDETSWKRIDRGDPITWLPCSSDIPSFGPFFLVYIKKQFTFHHHAKTCCGYSNTRQAYKTLEWTRLHMTCAGLLVVPSLNICKPIIGGHIT